MATKEEFLKWAKEANWFFVKENPIPTGHQAMFVTPTGQLSFPVFDLQGNVEGFAMMVPQAMPSPMRGLGSAFPGLKPPG